MKTGRRREDAIAVVRIPGCKEASEGRLDFAPRIKYAEASHGRSSDDHFPRSTLHNYPRMLWLLS